ncbi:hypothetical protein CXC20_004753 [Salmonella enterica subsp. enterica serovar Ealing]|uniref:Uncharacterized protein n=1 Tax=Salmonella enterica TaxID=28901 RepID=A0A5Z3T912_SALER|nr:hypothetical protein [Salmonella enterica]ECE6625728.1 hypothetical protein [Salmonella enterica subsp. diarizonae]EDF8426221.1 hypothetical protein [Salmonella enterica subsp. enterica serovar Montevideo]EDH6337862.1 hypothetical protein [Salmonella enterica subsp. enterica serovar Enteritidis]EEJ2091920.1 hypothetical protein [Salmonella enterica subsp. enterica serovar Ealing]
MASASSALPAFQCFVVLQSLRLFAVRKISVSIFDGVSNGGALREICGFAGGFTGEKLRENEFCFLIS